MNIVTQSAKRENALRWLLAGACFLMLIYFFSPSFAAFKLWHRVPTMQGGIIEVRRATAVWQQVEHPGQPITDRLHAAIQWRLLFPLIGYITGLPQTWFFCLSHLGALIALGYTTALLRSRRASWGETACIVLMLGASSWFFTSVGWFGYFDAWFALGLVVTAFARKSWMVWAACLLTPWVDERFVAAAPLVLLCRWLAQDPVEQKKPFAAWCRREALIPALLVTLFALIRLAALATVSAPEATLKGYLSVQNYLDAPASRIALGIWEGLRAAWFLLIAAIVTRSSSKGLTLALTGLVLSLVCIGLATAQDYSRAMTMLLPAAVLGAMKLVDARPAWLKIVLPVAAIGALLLPAHHVMNNDVRSIHTLDHELALLNSPPPVAIPELYELRAIHKMERGDFDGAEADLGLAIKLADDPSSAARQRGILYAGTKRWTDALKDFTTATENDAQNPEAWFMRAQANLALGNTTAARGDFSRALELAPANWNNRPDVTRFLVTLNRVSGER